jgi:hypothetical protein
MAVCLPVGGLDCGDVFPAGAEVGWLGPSGFGFGMRSFTPQPGQDDTVPAWASSTFITD